MRIKLNSSLVGGILQLAFKKEKIPFVFSLLFFRRGKQRVYNFILVTCSCQLNYSNFFLQFLVLFLTTDSKCVSFISSMLTDLQTNQVFLTSEDNTQERSISAE